MKRSLIQTLTYTIILTISLSGCSSVQDNNGLQPGATQVDKIIESITQRFEITNDNASDFSAPENQEENTIKSIETTVNGKIFTASLYNNETAKVFAELLPLTLDRSEMNSNEKYHYLDNCLLTAATSVSKITKND